MYAYARCERVPDLDVASQQLLGRRRCSPSSNGASRRRCPTTPANRGDRRLDGDTDPGRVQRGDEPATISGANFKLRDQRWQPRAGDGRLRRGHATARLTPTAPWRSQPPTRRASSAERAARSTWTACRWPRSSWSFTTDGRDRLLQRVDAQRSSPANPSGERTRCGVELGVKFRSRLAGFVSAIRFYKGSGNTGTHIGNLWDQRPATAAGDGDVHQRDGHGLAAGDVPDAGRDRSQHDLRRLVLRAERWLRQPTAATSPRRESTAGRCTCSRTAPTAATASTTTVRPSVFPTGTFNASQLLGRRRLHDAERVAECVSPANAIVAENCRVGSPPPRSGTSRASVIRASRASRPRSA